MSRSTSKRKFEPRTKPKDRFVGISMSLEDFARLKASAIKASHGNVAWFVRDAIKAAIAQQSL